MGEFNSFYKSINNRKFNTWCKYTDRLDTYGCGCQHNCSYCYSKSLLSFRGLWNPRKPRIANVSKIRDKMKGFGKHKVIKLGGMTDCFQPIETKERITYQAIKILNYYKIHYLIVTKSSLVSNDNYLQVYDKDLAHFQITITNTNDADCYKYEKASLASARIKSIEKLHKLGFDVSIRLSPFIKDNIDLRLLNKIRCNKILVEFLKVNHWVKKWFNIDYSDYTLKYGGYEHLQLENKIRLMNNINCFDQVSVGEYVNEHYIYFRDNVNFNKNDCCNINYTTPRVVNNLQLNLFYN